MTSLDAKLLAEVLANPMDDGPRLVFADALLGRNDPRGELIVAQCRLAEKGLGRDERVSLGQRAKALLAANPAWTAHVATLGGAIVRRGFVDEITTSAASLAKVAAAVFANEPVTRLTLTGASKDNLTALGDAGAFQRVQRLTLRGALGQAGVAALVAALQRRTIPLVSLNVASTGISGPTTKTLLGGLAGISTLVLTGNGIGDEGATAIANASTLGGLDTLYLSATELTDESLETLAKSSNLGALRRLSVARNEEVTTDGLRAIAKSKKLRGLSWLEWTDEEEVQQLVARRWRRA